MTDSINWCDLKKNAKHIGEVSTSRADGSPTGAEILTSTNEVTGQARDTLAGKFKKMDDAFSSITSSQFIVTNFGNWSTVAGQQIIAGDELKGYEYPDDSGDVYAVKGSITLPITRPPSPIGDDRFYLASAVNKTELDDSISNLTKYINDRIVSYMDYDSVTDPSQFDDVTLLTKISFDEASLGSIQGFEYDSINNKAYVTSYVNSGGSESQQVYIYNTDSSGSITTLDKTFNNVAVGHGESIVFDDEYFYVYDESTSSVNKVKISDSSSVSLPYPYERFDFYEDYSKVAMSKNGIFYIVDFDKFKSGNFTPDLILTKKSKEDKLVISGGNQSIKNRYGTYYGVSGFSASSSEQEQWKLSSYLSNSNGNTLKLWINDANYCEPQNVSWFADSNKNLKTVVIGKGDNYLYLLQCSNNTTSNEDLISDGLFDKLDNAIPLSRNRVMTESKNAFGAMAVFFGVGYTGGADKEDFSDFYATQDGAGNGRFSCSLYHHKKAKLSLLSSDHTADGWNGTFGYRYEITDPASRGTLSRFPFSVTANSIYIGEQTLNKDYASFNVKSASEKIGVNVYGNGPVDIGAVVVSTPVDVMYLGSFSVSGAGGVTNTRWYRVRSDELTPAVDSGADLGDPSIRFENIHLVNAPSVTCDARAKTKPRSVDSDEGIAVMRAIRKVPFNFYEYLEAVEKKGGTYDSTPGGARTHFGPMAQDIIRAFESEGLDPWKYALVQKEAWEHKDAEYDEHGNLLQKGATSGERLKVRMDQFIMMRLASI